MNRVTSDIIGVLGMDGISDSGPFRAVITKRYIENGYTSKSYRYFESLQQARDWLYTGSVMIAQQGGYKVTKALPELLRYENDKHAVSIYLVFEREGEVDDLERIYQQ